MEDTGVDDKVVLWFCFVGVILTAIGVYLFVRLFKKDDEQRQKLIDRNL